MSKMSLKLKLGIGFGSLLVLIVLMGYFSYSSSKQAAEISSQVTAAMDMKDASVDVARGMWQGLASCRAFLLTGREEYLRDYEEGKGGIADAVNRLGKMELDEGEKKSYSEMQRYSAGLEAAQAKAIELRRNGNEKEAVKVLFSSEVAEIRAAFAALLKQFDELQDQQLQESRLEERALESRSQTMALALAGIGIVVGLIVAILIARSITGVIARMVAVIQEIASNDLTADDLEVTSKDEIGQAGIALNKMKNNLREVIQAIAGTAEHVASASEEISSSASLQAQGAETQKDQAAQVATAMQEMSSTVLQVSENSNRAAEASRQAAETAREGGNIVEETLAKMRTISESVQGTARKVEELGKSSDQIGRIAGVIDDIADQTNLLALNAAIEAARAGEQGRGFAVVADEVRKLAERTTTATKEIAQMIENIQNETKVAVVAMETGTRQVEEGVESTSKAGASLRQIIHMSEQVGEMITHIATAATEQSSASEEVNNNMEQIAKLVRESAEGAKQSAQACQDLSGLALDLQKMVSNFKVGSGDGVQSGSRGKPRAVGLGSGRSAGGGDRISTFAASAAG